MEMVEFMESLVLNNSVFRDESKLSLEYIPKEALFRKDQIEKLFFFLDSILEHTPQALRIILYGEDGTGKTLVTRIVIPAITDAMRGKKNLVSISLDMRKMKTEYMVLNTILRCLNKSIPRRGFSQEELIDILWDILDQSDIYLVLILDNLGEGHYNTLYDLIRINDKSDDISRVSLILVTDNLGYINNIPEYIPLPKNFIVFKQYTTDQLYVLLKNRCSEAFNTNAISDKLIRYVSENVGNLRDAIQTLWRAGKYADISKSQNIEDKHIIQASETPFDELSNLDCLSIDQKVLLLATMSCNKTLMTTNELESQYILVCTQIGIIAKKHTILWQNMKVLEKKGYISTEISGNGYRGKTTLISPNKKIKDLGAKLVNSIIEYKKEKKVE